ncbi:hypothetical protein OB03_01785 [Brevundimonas sp. GN22]|uniref:hypothetical protein n=1 Tax=Brevundimonas pishanensis TaxID=2896315 RepID=UPI001FA6BA7B|nr:hypothetical protein [Brevundimonas pishanensis]
MSHEEVWTAQPIQDAAHDTARETAVKVRATEEEASFAPRVPRKEFGLRRVPPSVLKSLTN